MKNFLFTALLIASAFGFTACEDDDDSDFRNATTWELTAALSDPGDGSGTFQPIDSDRRITLLPDGTYTALGDICTLDHTEIPPTAGTYDLDRETIQPDDCVTIGGTPIGLQISGDELTIRYLCREGCAHRFTRVRS